MKAFVIWYYVLEKIGKCFNLKTMHFLVIGPGFAPCHLIQRTAEMSWYFAGLKFLFCMMLLYWITFKFWYGGQGLNQKISCLDQTERIVLVPSFSIMASASLRITGFSKSAIKLEKRQGRGPQGEQVRALTFCLFVLIRGKMGREVYSCLSCKGVFPLFHKEGRPSLLYFAVVVLGL